MPTMETDWQHRRRPLHDSSLPTAALPTLPSVAELIASSKPSSSTIAAYHHESSPLPPIQCSTPHNPAALPAPANAPAGEQSYFGAVQPTSRASPTGSATSTTLSDRQYYHQQPAAQPASTQGAAFEGYHSEAGQGRPPISSGRQDSAVAHHRPDTAKDGLSFAPPTEPNFLYSHRSPNDTHRPASPALSYSTSSSSAPPSSTFVPATSTTSHDHVTSPSASAHGHPALDPSPALPSDHSNIPNTRQQRYNVRFAANYTSENMPSVQRSRPSPPLPATPAPAEVPEPPRPVPVPAPAPAPAPVQQPAPTSLDRARQAIIGSYDRPTRNSSEPQESSVERCPICHEAWSPPLRAQSESKKSPAKSAFDFAMATDLLYAQQRQHAKDADEAFAQWKEKHSHCPQKPAQTNPNPVYTQPPNHAPSNGHSNKRKSEVPHGDASKMMRHDFDGHVATAPPVQPSTSS